jgi:DNA-binding Lrp family transcriptional regulator
MSGKAVGWVFDNSKTTSTTDLVVFVAIAEHAGHSVFEAWPSQEAIAKMCRLSERAVRNAIDRLAALGELSVIERRDAKGRRLRTYYRVVTDPEEQAKVAKKWAEEHPKREDAEAPGGPPAPRSGGQESVSPPASHDSSHRHLTTVATGISRQSLIEEPSTENRQREPSDNLRMVPERSKAANGALTRAPIGEVPQSGRDTLTEPEAGIAISNAQALASLMATLRVDTDGDDLAPPAEPGPPPVAAHSSTNGNNPPRNGKPDLEALIATWNANRGTLPSCTKVPSPKGTRDTLLRLWEDADGDLELMAAGFRAASQDEFYQANNYGIVTVARNFAGRWQGIASRKREIDAECDRWRPAE